ncbi:MAG: hypothetical protein M1833_003381 [Piccolia ochrophora]|nr:MAG: hypothetical protein M1833_003381 [Piccolia ochrophora]
MNLRPYLALALFSSAHSLVASARPVSVEAAPSIGGGAGGAGVHFSQGTPEGIGGGSPSGGSVSVASLLGSPVDSGTSNPSSGGTSSVPEPPSPFPATSTTSSLVGKIVCFGASNGAQMCLPSGTFDIVPSVYTFPFNQVVSIDMPPGVSSKVEFFIGQRLIFSADAPIAPMPGSPLALAIVQALDPNNAEPATIVINTVDYPCFCIMDGTAYKNQTKCWGEGESTLSDPYVNTASSYILRGGATAKLWFSPVPHGAPEGDWYDNVSQDVPDLGPQAKRLGGIQVRAPKQ